MGELCYRLPCSLFPRHSPQYIVHSITTALSQVGVHIADLSYFVRPGTALDLEAQKRGTSVYLCDKRIDMVPGVLSSNLCSLRANEDRLAFSGIWEMTK